MEEGVYIYSGNDEFKKEFQIVGINECNNVKIGWADNETLIIEVDYVYFMIINLFESSRSGIKLKICFNEDISPKLNNSYSVNHCFSYQLTL